MHSTQNRYRLGYGAADLGAPCCALWTHCTIDCFVQLLLRLFVVVVIVVQQGIITHFLRLLIVLWVYTATFKTWRSVWLCAPLCDKL